MRGPSQVKREFLRKWAKGLQIYSDSNKDMSFLERKKAIKLSADVAMASTTTCWGRALIADASKNRTTKVVVEHVLGHDENISNNNVSWLKKSPALCSTNKKVRFKKILRKSCALCRQRKTEPPKVLATCVAKRMVKKRTQMLKNLVPGGKLMDDVSIIQEALDYIISLRVQVKVMRQLAKISELVNHRT